MYRVGAGEQQRIEQHRETGMEIPPSGVGVQHIRCADDCQASWSQHPMKLPRECELVLDVFDHFQAARDVDRPIFVRQPAVR